MSWNLVLLPEWGRFSNSTIHKFPLYLWSIGNFIRISLLLIHVRKGKMNDGWIYISFKKWSLNWLEWFVSDVGMGVEPSRFILSHCILRFVLSVILPHPPPGQLLLANNSLKPWKSKPLYFLFLYFVRSKMPWACCWITVRGFDCTNHRVGSLYPLLIPTFSYWIVPKLALNLLLIWRKHTHRQCNFCFKEIKKMWNSWQVWLGHLFTHSHSLCRSPLTLPPNCAVRPLADLGN